MLFYDPPSGWMYGFPKPYKPLDGESLTETLLRDGYPQKEIDNGGAKHVRFIGVRDELDKIVNHIPTKDTENV
jgi:hypothetical protein